MEIDTVLWDKIDEELGTITEFRIIIAQPKDNSTFAQIHFKSNGIDKVIACNDENFKFFIQCAYYVGDIISPLKKYKRLCETLQHSL